MPVPGLRWWWEEDVSEDGKPYQVTEVRRFAPFTGRPGETVSCQRYEIWKDTGFPRRQVIVKYIIEGANGDIDKIDTGISQDELMASGKATHVSKMEYSCEAR